MALVTYAGAYLAVGALVVVQALARRLLRLPRDLEGAALLVGAMVLWLPALVIEVVTYVRERRWRS